MRRCLWQCKDTNFSANHNNECDFLCLNKDVYDNAKILIFQQITTFIRFNYFKVGCLWQCKDTNFSANHNFLLMEIFLLRDVYDNAKILIFQQITTGSSVSQLNQGCLWQCKDTNFSANHNTVRQFRFQQVDVYDNAKILIFQQITTELVDDPLVKRCLWQCKDTNFSANHNVWILWWFAFVDVYDNAKILIFQQITTCKHLMVCPVQMFMTMQRY